jgi:cell division protein FtsL
VAVATLPKPREPFTPSAAPPRDRRPARPRVISPNVLRGPFPTDGAAALDVRTLDEAWAPRAVRRTVRRGQVSPLRRAVMLAGVPVLFLVLYVSLWTVAMRGGYQKNRLTTQIRALEIENDSLQAEVRGLQSPARILQEASKMQMERAADIKFVEIPVASRFAKSQGGEGDSSP